MHRYHYDDSGLCRKVLPSGRADDNDDGALYETVWDGAGTLSSDNDFDGHGGVLDFESGGKGVEGRRIVGVWVVGVGSSVHALRQEGVWGKQVLKKKKFMKIARNSFKSCEFIFR